ncbi:ferric reductase-like transmembrane domain-containing protein [Brevibacillus marinus]|uniref:ferric reductase-like transmembrane domain-containing protein n=1 Tax=Brevibacillus marinus TaxID=2496837 RepID=UPI001F4954E8|nr:ferric reductase-like transmembrane domain-containing protein [Brevibacillus marinus]
MAQAGRMFKQARRRRIAVNAVLFLMLLLLARTLWPQFSHFPAREAWSMMLGYTAFIGVGVTLLIGPLKQWLPRQWASFLLTLRRDVGIWTGFAAILHVALVLISFERGVEFLFFLDPQQPSRGWLYLFLEETRGGWSLNISMMGIANYLGLLAFCCILAMWLTSSSRAERLMGGAAWKRLHLSNPLCFWLLLLHGLIYVEGIKAEPLTWGDLLPLFLLVMLLRLAAYATAVVRSRKARIGRKA